MQSNYQQAAQRMSRGEFQQAEVDLRAILANRPNDGRSLSLLGHSLLAQKKTAQAAGVFQNLVSGHPRSESAWIELAAAYLALNDFDKAEQAFLGSVDVNPNQSEAWLFLGNIAMQKGNREKATTYFKNSEKNDPFKDTLKKAFKNIESKNFALAEKHCRDVLQYHANHPIALFILAQLANQVRAHEESIKILHQGLKHSPYNVRLLQSLATSYASLGRYDKAIDTLRKALVVEPDNAELWCLLASELANIGLNKDSAAAYQKAIDLAPDEPRTYLKLGHQLRISGQREECEVTYQKAIDIGGINGAIYWAKADLKAYRFDHDEVIRMKNYFKNKQIPVAQRCQAGFAIAKALEDKKEYSAAFDYYQKANALKPGNHFNPEEYSSVCENIRDAFNQNSLTVQATPQAGPRPIFIVSLPRSGSTLIEQILGSHSQIEGTMELFQIPNLVRRINILGGKRGKKKFPEAINLFNEEDLTRLGQSYLDETAVFRSGKPFFIDKLPPNFHQVGLIHKVLPNAIIIDARRHPMSVGFSNFKQHFASGNNFSYNLKHIGDYYNDYLKLMDYWNSTLPGKILTVQYESLVQNTENQVRNLLQHCGLTFEQTCLEFYKNKRAVRTPSSEQVRQPIYQTSTHQWHYFEKFLSPLKLSLGEKTLERFSTWS